MERATAQGLALRADQVVAVKSEAAFGDGWFPGWLVSWMVGFLDGMNGAVGGDTPFLKQLPQLTDVVAGVSGQRHRPDGQWLQQARDRLPFSFRCVGNSATPARWPVARRPGMFSFRWWVTLLLTMKPPKSTMMFSW